MKKYTLIIIFYLFGMHLFAQIDAVKISSAKKAYENAEYQIALESLNEVSAASQKSKLFYYYRGYSFYKLKQYDSAEVYLKKYLLVDITNTDVVETLGDIDYERKRKIKADDEKAKKIAEDERMKNLNGI